MESGILGRICMMRNETCAPHECTSGIYVGLEHIDSGQFRLSRSGVPSEVRSAKNRFYPGDVLYGKLRPYLDKAVVAETEGICSTDILVLEPLEAPSWFLCGVLHTNPFIEHAKQTTHGVNHPRTSWSGIKDFEITTFPLPEQKKIAAVLLKIQRAIETQEKIIQSLCDLKKSTMQHLFTHGLRGEKTKMTEIGEIPESWEVRPLGEITDITAGGTPSRSNQAYWQNGTIPWVKTGEIDYCIITTTEEHITKLGLENSSAKLYDTGTLLLAMYGQGITRGKVALLGIEAATNQASAAVIPKGNSVKTPFIYHYLTWSYDRLRSHSHGAQQANLNAKIVAGFPITIPFQVEQEDIATALDTLDSMGLVNESQKSALQDLFKTTLNKLMTGDIRVGDLDIDVSEVEE